MAVSINGTTGLTGVAAIDDVSSTELGYLDGVTSAIQGQLDGKQAAASTGTWTPSILSGGTLTSTASASYIKIGSLVIAYCEIVVSLSGASQLQVGGLPFRPASRSALIQHSNTNFRSFGGGIDATAAYINHDMAAASRTLYPMIAYVA